MIVCINTVSSSIIKHFLCLFSDAIKVDPLHQNKSKILSQGLLLLFKAYSISSTGFWVGWTYSLTFALFILHTVVFHSFSASLALFSIFSNCLSVFHSKVLITVAWVLSQ